MAMSLPPVTHRRAQSLRVSQHFVVRNCTTAEMQSAEWEVKREAIKMDMSVRARVGENGFVQRQEVDLRKPLFVMRKRQGQGKVLLNLNQRLTT